MTPAFVQAGGHRLEYRWVEPPAAASDRATLVFLHEGLGCVALWKDFPARVAAATGCAALVYSRYGYGKSDRLTAPRAVDYMHHEALVVLPELLEALAIRAPILVGHSDGASIALIHAGARARAVRAVVALAPHVFVEDLSLTSIAQAKTAFETTDLRDKLARYHDDVDSAFRGWNDIWLHADFRDWNIEDYLPGIGCPVALIQGAGDRYGTRAQLEAIERAVSGPVETHLLPACGHSPHVDQPQATLRILAHFVALVARQ